MLMSDLSAKIMLRVSELFTESGLTLDELGQRMGYVSPSARHSAWQFLNRTADPRLSMLCRFAVAIGVPIAELFVEKKKGRSK
jgi:transcriptional regulator with XRE-family HTH domain